MGIVRGGASAAAGGAELSGGGVGGWALMAFTSATPLSRPPSFSAAAKIFELLWRDKDSCASNCLQCSIHAEVADSGRAAGVSGAGNRTGVGAAAAAAAGGWSGAGSAPAVDSVGGCGVAEEAAGAARRSQLSPSRSASVKPSKLKSSGASAMADTVEGHRALSCRNLGRREQK